MKTTDFIKESALAVAAEAMDKESEVQAAREDCFHIAKGSIELYHLLKTMPEVTDLDNECVSKLNLAAQYIEDALQYFNVMQEPALEGAFTFESAEARFNELLDESMDFDQIRKDAEANLKANFDKQSDARIAAAREPKEEPKKKGFWQSVGDKQIGMVKGAVTGAVKGFKGQEVEEGIAEDATGGATGASSVAAVVGGLGEKTGQKSLLKRQGAISNVLQPPKSIKVKGGY